MAFAPYEASKHSASPIRLFKFNFGPLPEDEKRYTNADTDQAFENKAYEKIPITHGQISATTGTLDKSALEIRTTVDSELSEVFRIAPPSYVVQLIIYQGQNADPDNQFLACWSGRIVNASWERSELVMTGEPVTTSMRRAGPRRNYQKSCPHALYDNEQGSCNAPKIPLDVTCSAVYIQNTITVSSVGGDPLAYMNGSIEWVGANGRRQILSVKSATSGGVLLLAGTPVGLTPGTPMKLYKGCDHTMGPRGCAMHNNIVNYGGQPWIPLENPVNRIAEFN